MQNFKVIRTYKYNGTRGQLWCLKQALLDVFSKTVRTIMIPWPIFWSQLAPDTCRHLLLSDWLKVVSHDYNALFFSWEAWSRDINDVTVALKRTWARWLICHETCLQTIVLNYQRRKIYNRPGLPCLSSHQHLMWSSD